MKAIGRGSVTGIFMLLDRKVAAQKSLVLAQKKMLWTGSDLDHKRSSKGVLVAMDNKE